MTYDTLHMGRSSIDLYSDDIGAAFVDITRFAAFVGGSPTNISVGAKRLGLNSALLTAVGADLVGDFILNFLNKEGVETKFIPRKPGHRTSAVLLGIEPPDRFPLIYYRDNCADMELTIDDVLAAPIGQTKVLQFAGTNLYKDPCRSATLFAAEMARRNGTEVVLDIDFRPDQWHDPRAFGVVLRQAVRLSDVVVGTEDEVKAAAGTGPVTITHSQISDPRVAGDTVRAIRRVLEGGPSALVVKRGAQGATVYTAAGEVIDAAPFPVQVLNVLGGGDAFASGLIYGYLQGWDWHRAARMGNAVGAIVVTRPACANDMPTLAEVEAFVAERGGL